MKYLNTFLALASVLLFVPICQAQQAKGPQPSGGAPKILFNQKFQTVAGQPLAAAAPAAAPAPLAPGDGYATVKYSIGTPQQKQHIQDTISTIAKTLPETFGNSDGTYTVTITVTDLGGKLLAKEPILSFQWTKQAQFIFFQNVVDQIQKTSWSGTLINQMPITDSTGSLKISMEVYSQKSRSLDFDLLKKTAKDFNAGALSSLLPLPAAAVPMIGAVADLINSLYASSAKQSLVDEDEVPMQTAAPIKSQIAFEGGESIPVNITVGTQPSRFSSALSNGKFTSPPDESIFSNAGIQIADNRPVGIIELISTSTDAKLKSVRALLDAVTVGGTYGKDPANKKEGNVSILCGNLYDGLNLYLSKYDARAMFWVFLNRYGDQFDKAACLGSRKFALDQVGLPL